MSIFTKMVILFLLSISLMMIVSNEINTITQSKIELLMKEKYQQASNELFKYLSNNDKNALDKKLVSLNFKTRDISSLNLERADVIYDATTSFGEIKILKDTHQRYVLYMRYLDEILVAQDASQEESFVQKDFLGLLIFADIFILIIIFFLMYTILSPLKKLSKEMQHFGDGSLHVRMHDLGNNELGRVSRAFNTMADNIEALIHSRQQLLRDIGHELRTPIAKAKFAVTMLPPQAYQMILQKAISQMDTMTEELLSLEKLNAHKSALNKKTFNTETLIFEALSKLYLEDERFVELQLHETFEIEGDLHYLSIALKNLVDNALKYASEKPIIIETTAHAITVKSQGEPLAHPLAYYCEAFVQSDTSRGQEGFGLGLSIVQKIVDAHEFGLELTCNEGYNSFIIRL